MLTSKILGPKCLRDQQSLAEAHCDTSRTNFGECGTGITSMQAIHGLWEVRIGPQKLHVQHTPNGISHHPLGGIVPKLYPAFMQKLLA